MNTPKLPPLPEPDMYADPCDANGMPTEYYTEATVMRLLAAIEAQGVPDAMRTALQRIADRKSHDLQLAVGRGSNGVRDFYRQIAIDALASAPPAPQAALHELTPADPNCTTCGGAGVVPFVSHDPAITGTDPCPTCRLPLQAERTALDYPAGVPKPTPIGHCRPNGIVYDLPPLTFTAAHLCEALEFFGGEYGDADDPTQVCIALRDEGHDTDGEMRPRGLYVWLKEYPEEGALHLPVTTPPAPQAAVVQQEPTSFLVRGKGSTHEWATAKSLDVLASPDEWEWVPQYTHPAQQAKPQPLSDKEADRMTERFYLNGRPVPALYRLSLVRATERHHGIKE